MNTLHPTQGPAACRPAPTSPATAAARRAGQVAEGVYDNRRARLKLLIAERAGGSQRAFAKLLGYTRSNIHHFLSTTYNYGRSMGERAARKLEHKAGLPYGWLDQAIEVAAPVPGAEDADTLLASSGGMTASADCPICGIPADITRVPTTPDEAIAFIGSHFNCQYDADKPENIRYELSVHDILSAFRWWFDTDLPEQAGREASAGVAAGSAETRMVAGFQVSVEVGTELAENLRRSRIEAKWWLRCYKREFGRYPVRYAVDDIRKAAWLFERLRVEEATMSAVKRGMMRRHLLRSLGIAELRLRAMLAPMANTGVTTTDVTQVQRDLARLTASDNSDLVLVCIRAQAVIEGLLSGLDVEQLS